MKAQGPDDRVQRLRRLAGQSVEAARIDSLRRLLAEHRVPVIVAGAAAALIAVVTLAVLMSGDEEERLPRGIEPPGFAVSPEGDRIMLQLQGDGAWLFDLRDGSARRVLGDPSAEEFTWSPDGRRVAYYSRRSGQWAVWLIAPG